jgi:ribonuclease R
MASLPDDYWAYDEATQTLSGRRSRAVFTLAQNLEVRLNEAKPVTGGLLFGLGESLPSSARPPRARTKPDKAGAKNKQKRRR